MTASIHEGPVPGCIERIVALHANYYSLHAGFGEAFESRVARELTAFCVGLVPERDALWLVIDQVRVEGSIAIDGSHALQDGAHLRWFILSDSLRGQGWGNRLLATAMRFCRDCGHARLYLETFRGLDAARHLYEKHGFRLVHEARGRQWGKEVAEQRFEAILPESGNRAQTGAE